MRIARAVLVAGCLVAIVCGAEPHVAGQEKVDKATQNRVAELLEVLDRPDARDRNLDGTVEAMAELEKIGGPACPHLVDAALGKNLVTANYARRVLVKIGKPALPAIRARWGDLNDERRWQLVPVFEAHDPAVVREYALNCLDADGAARGHAWGFMLRTKEPRAKERYFKVLKGEEAVGWGWPLLPTAGPIYDEDRENDVMIELLDPKSWVTKGIGRVHPAGAPPLTWPDGRPLVIAILRERKVGRAAPALLKVLQEKGVGQGYFVGLIVPLLAEFGYQEAIPELEQIAASKPKSGKLDEPHPYAAPYTYRFIRDLATDSVQKIRNIKK